MKIIDAASLDLANLLQPGDLIAWGEGSAEPVTLIEILLAQRERLGKVRAFLGMSVSGALRPEHADHISFLSYGAVTSVGALQRAGVLDLMPCNYSAVPSLIASRRLPIDVVFVQVSPPGPDGTYSLGFCNSFLPVAIEHARVVIAEINTQVPWVHQDVPLATERVHCAIESSREPPSLPIVHPSETDQQIARHIASLINDGDTLQYGIGSIPTALLAALSGHRRLGLHTGLFTDPLIDLIEQGVITNENKAIHRGVSVAAFAIGSARLQALMHNNPAMALHQLQDTHGAATLSRIDNLMAINSALEVDLYGQVNAEQVGNRYLGTIGGQVDFMHAASTSRNGSSVIAMPSTAAKSGATRITARLNGPFVTTARADVDIVVSEHGIADLRGKTLSQRAKAIIKLAAPEHREALQAHCP